MTPRLVNDSGRLLLQREVPLTARQDQILRMIGTGLQTKQIAAELHISTQAVNKVCVAMRRKLKLPSHVALACHVARALA